MKVYRVALPDGPVDVAGRFRLRPGDIISTGTPAGIRPLAVGDSVEVEGVGVLRNPVTLR